MHAYAWSLKMRQKKDHVPFDKLCFSSLRSNITFDFSIDNSHLRFMLANPANHAASPFLAWQLAQPDSSIQQLHITVCALCAHVPCIHPWKFRNDDHSNKPRTHNLPHSQLTTCDANVPTSCGQVLSYPPHPMQRQITDVHKL